MDLQGHLKQLESNHDWQGIVDELERGLAGETQGAAKAALHLRLGRVLHEKFLQSVKALKHFQDAYKLNSALVEALEEARAIYWELAKPNMVQKLLDLELKTAQDGPRTSALLVELGDVLSDQGDYERAVATYAKAIASSQGQNEEASACLEDAQSNADSWQERVALLLREAHAAPDAASKSRLFVRAARVARRFAPEAVLGMAEQAYGVDPTNREAAALFEGALIEAKDHDALVDAQRRATSEIADPALRAAAYLRFGAAWLGRHQVADRAADWLAEAVVTDPSHDAALAALREIWGTRDGNWERVVELIDRASVAHGGQVASLLAEAGTLAWRKLGNLMRARGYFEQLAALQPEHTTLSAFEAQIGESLRAAPASAPVVEAEAAAVPVVEAEAASAPVVAVAAAPQAQEAAPTSARAPASGPMDEAKIAELRALATKQEAAKRYNEYVRTLVQLAHAVPNVAEKIDLYQRAADLFVQKFANQAEAVKAYEAIVELDAENAHALEFLRQAYEKRRDWEKLLGLQRREAARLPGGSERAMRFLEIAKLATERVKKPDVCIELWREVLASDAENLEALSALAGLYERARNFEALVEVLEKEATVTFDSAQRVQVLSKLATTYGDRLANDEGAVRAWRALLAIDPNDRKAQETLKKKYLALGLWDELDVFYVESGKWDELIRLLESQEAKEQVPATKIGLLVKVAKLWADKRQKSDRAAKAYEKVLELDPDSIEAADALVPIYHQVQNQKGLASALEVKLRHEQEPSAKLELLRELAGLYEGKLKDAPRAFDRLLAAFELGTSDERSVEDLERTAKAAGRWEDFVAALRKAIGEAESASDRALAVALRLRVGRVLVEELERTDEALAEFRAVHDADPDDAQALAALERLYRQTARYTDLLDVYQQRRALETDAVGKREILHAIAALYENELGDPPKAVEAWEAVLEEDPSDATGLASLDALYEKLERRAQHADVLRRRIEVETDDARVIDLKFRLGQTLERHLDDPAAALECYREILALDPAHDGARTSLEALLAHDGLKAEAAAVLANIYELRSDFARLVSALEILAAAEDDTHARVELLGRIARIAETSLDDVNLAFDAQARALREDPSQAAIRNELERLAGLADAWGRLEHVLEKIAETVSDPDLARIYWMRQGYIDERLGKVDEAAGGYLHVLAQNPADEEALAALDALYRGVERWEDLITVFRRRIDLAVDSSTRESLFAQVADIYEGKLARPADAIAAYREVLASEATSQVALVALDGLFTRQSLWPDLAENLEAQLALAAGDDAQVVLMLRLAALREQQMALIADAIEGYRQVLERDASNATALAALERLGASPEHEIVVAEILEPLYRGSGDWQKLVGVHEVQVRRADDPTRRVELLHQIAALHEDAGGDAATAFATFARALAEEPTSEVTLAGIDRLARITGCYADLAQTYERLAGAQSDVRTACALWSAAARVFENDLGDVDAAVRLYRQVLSSDPSNLAAAEALEALFRGAQRWAELSAILQSKADIVEDVDDKKRALFAAAQIEDEVLGRAEAAIAVYNKALEVDGEDLAAIDALIRLYLGLSRWTDLLAVHSRKVELVADVDEKKRIFYQVGAIYERELSDTANAIDSYAKVLELDPDDVTALGRLDVLYGRAGNWRELLGVLVHQAELTEDANDAIALEFRIAELYEKKLDEVERSIDLYREVLVRDAAHQPTLAALEGLKSGEVAPLAAAAVLESVYEAAGEWAKLVSVLDVQARLADDPMAKVDLLHRIAALLEERLSDPSGALDVYARAVVVDSSNETSLAQVERLAAMVGRWADVGKLYDAEIERLAANPERLVELGLRTAALYETRLGDVATSIARFQRVLEADAENFDALAALDRLFTQTEKWAELVAILVREAEVGQTPDDILDLKFRRGQVQEHRLGDVDAAIAAYREVLAAAPEHAATLEALERLFASGVKQLEIGEILEPLYQAAGDWQKLLGVEEAELGSITAQADRLTMYYRIAELAEEKLLDAPRALDAFVRALKEAPLDERSGEEVERLAGAIEGGWETLGNAYADVLGLHTDVAVLRTIGRRLARTFEEELGDITKAEETYRYVVGVDPLDPEALANLDRIYSSLEQWKELAGVLEARVQATGETQDLVDLYARLGQVYEERLARVEDAVRAYRKIFDGLEPSHEGAIDALARIFEQTEAWKELDAVYQRQLDNATGDVQEAEIRAKVAALASTRLGDADRAIETWKRVLDLRGEDPEALVALADLYERTSHWAELSDVLEREYETVTTDEARTSVLLRRARVFRDKLGRDEQALGDFQRALEADIGNLEALRAIADIWRRRNEPVELVAALHQTADRGAGALEPAELVEVYRELARTYGEKLEQPFDAAEVWRKLLDIAPGDFAALDALEAIYRVQEQWTDVIAVKVQRAEALSDAGEQVRELLEVADVWETQVGEPDSATAIYEKVLLKDPAHDRAFHALEKLHAEAGRWEPLVELLLHRLDSRTESREKVAILCAIARVVDEKLADKAQAYEALLNAFAEDYADDETVRYLERITQATGRWSELVQSADAWLKAATDSGQIVRLALRIAKWYGEDLNHPELAQPYFNRVLQIDPKNVAAMRQMASQYRKNAQWQQLGQTLTKALDVAILDVDRKEILTDLGELLDKHMKETDQAVAYFDRALEVDADHMPALEALERIHEARGEHRELASVLARKVRAISDPVELATAKLRMAGLYESPLGEFEKAAAAYREVLAADAASLPALRGLERVYEKKQSFTELAAVLEQQLEVVDSERERMEVLMKLAKVQEEQFVKLEVAAERLQQVLEIDPSHEPALVALERCYRRLRRFPELVDAYERHVSATLDRAQKIELYGLIARVYADEIGEVDRAVDAYRNVIDIDDTNVAALEALAKLYEKQGEAAQAIECMTRVADLTADGKQRVEMYYRIARALDERLGERMQAQERYEMALDLDPAHVPTLAALREIALANEDWDRAARFLDQEQQHTAAPRQRAKLLVELGAVRDDKLGEHDLAVIAWQLALQYDDDNEDAATPLLREYVERERWADAEPLAELLVRKSHKRERSEQHDVQKTLGRVAAALGKFDKAFKAYSEANRLDMTDRDTIRGLADVAFALQDWASSLSNYQKVLTSLEESEVEARADVYHRLGTIKREQGQAKAAIGNYEKALALVSTHRASLEALVDLYVDAKDWKQVAAYKRQILDDVFEAKERIKLLNEIGDIWGDKEKNVPKAIETFEEALDIEPENLPILHKLLQLHGAAESWAKMIETLDRIAELEKVPERKAQYVYTKAQIYRDKLEDLEAAIDGFNETLDLNPTKLEAFERINKVLTTQKDWKGLERAFRKMLHRVAGKGNTELEFNLWHNLGIIYRDRLGDAVPAVEAFKMAARLRPDEIVERQILAELYERTDRLVEAAAEQQEILQRDPLRPEPYRALYKIYLRQQSYDAAWCTAAALAFFQKADAEELQFFEDYRPRGMLPVKGRLDDKLWAAGLFHADENLYIGKIYEFLARAALTAKMAQLKAAKQLPVLEKKFRQDPATSTVTFAKTFGWAAAVLGVACPELYVCSDVQGALGAQPVSPPATLAGRSVLTGFTPQELAFICAKHLCGYRGEHYIKNLFATEAELKQVLFAGIKIARPDLPVPAEIAPQVNAVAAELAKYLEPVYLDGLQRAVKLFVENGAKANVKRWSQAVDFTASRAGLLLSGDLDIAKKIMAAEPAMPGDLPAADKMKELIVYSVSEPYFALRKLLGIAISA